jgi:hypothetical protein
MTDSDRGCYLHRSLQRKFPAHGGGAVGVWGCDVLGYGHHGVGLGRLGLREGVGGQDLLLRLDNGDTVGQRLLGTNLASRIPRQHNFHLQIF